MNDPSLAPTLLCFSSVIAHARTPSVLRTRSLSAGSDLDKLKILSDQTGGKINSLVNLTSVGASPHTARRLSSNASPVPVAAAGSILLTESIQSINKGSGSIS